jgi:hypothetical protein
VHTSCFELWSSLRCNSNSDNDARVAIGALSSKTWIISHQTRTRTPAVLVPEPPSLDSLLSYPKSYGLFLLAVFVTYVNLSTPDLAKIAATMKRDFPSCIRPQSNNCLTNPYPFLVFLAHNDYRAPLFLPHLAST